MAFGAGAFAPGAAPHPGLGRRAVGRGAATAEAVTVLDSARGRTLVNVLTAELIVIVVLQKLAIPFSGDSQIALALPIHLSFIAFLAYRQYISISVVRLLLYTAMAVTATLTHALLLTYTLTSFSVPSVFLFLVIYASYIFVMRVDRPLYLAVVNRFQLIALGASAMVGLDWVAQITRIGMPDLDKIIPYDFIYNYYNYIQPLKWRSVWIKPNGVFFLEASHTSQFLAMALVLEIVLFRRLKFIAIFASSLLATFAGTGLFLVMTALPLLLMSVRPIYIIAAVVAAPLLLAGASYTGWIDNVAHRQDEFDRDGSSANQRFVAPIEAVSDALTKPNSSPLIGIGAGNMPRALNITWNPLSKVFVEYGLLTFCLWLAYVLFSNFGGGAKFVAAWVVMIQYHFLNGALLVPLHTVYCILLAGGYIVTDPRPGPED